MRVRGLSPTDAPEALEAFLTTFSSPEPLSLAALFDAIHREHFTGPITFHFQEGLPRKFEVGMTIQFPLDTPSKRRP